MLYLIASPIGNPKEISLLSLEKLKEIKHVIVESTKETSRLLKFHGLSGKIFHLLNEHSTADDTLFLSQLCAKEDVGLLTDAGTPGFCDPGSELVRICRKNKTPIRTLLGPSSLMGILSLSGRRLDQFVFRGFLPAETLERKKELGLLAAEKRPIVLMDTPYRLKKTLEDLKEFFPKRHLLLALNLSQADELHLEGIAQELLQQLPASHSKAEFMILIY